jgi:hypothetical protein
MLEREPDQVGARGQIELLMDVRAVRLDRAHRQEQLTGDLRVGVSQRDQPQDLDLSVAEIPGTGIGGGRGQPSWGLR